MLMRKAPLIHNTSEKIAEVTGMRGKIAFVTACMLIRW